MPVEEIPPASQAYQRTIREDLQETEPKPVVLSLAGYSVEMISRSDALPVILRYEWLGTLGSSAIFVGLLSPERELHGALCFGYGPGGGIRGVIGEPALCLERGACVHYAPPNAASFLINAACKLVYRATGIAIFFAYSDPMAGEYGGVYQASGWIYLGQGIKRAKERRKRLMVLPPGKDPALPNNWSTTRMLREGRHMSFAEARAAGWRIGYREAKHIYATNVGPARKRWKKRLVARPYPSPRPELKLKSLTSVIWE